MRADSKQSSAMAVALKFLAISERFEQEVRTKLADFEEDEVERVIASLKKEAILNDRRTIESYTRSRSGRRAVGAHRIEYELRKRGASEELIAEFAKPDEELGQAKALLESKFRQDLSLKPKAFRFLLSRGFGYETAHNAIRDYFSEDV